MALLEYLNTIEVRDESDHAIKTALIAAKGHQAAAARSLGISNNDIRFFLQRYGYYSG